MDFLHSAGQSGPFDQKRFGLCDDQNTTPAYVDTDHPDKWVATVENPSGQSVIFTAIDKCVIQDAAWPGQGRCDGMLTAPNLLYLVELKDQKSDWQQRAIGQLASTIELLVAHHDLQAFRHKKAFACNKRHKVFVPLDSESKLRFFRKYGFRIDLQATVLVVPPT